MNHIFSKIIVISILTKIMRIMIYFHNRAALLWYSISVKQTQIKQIHLHWGHLADTFIQSDFQLHFNLNYNSSTFSKKRETIHSCRYSKDAHRTKCQALTITRLTHPLCTTEIARIIIILIIIFYPFVSRAPFLPTQAYKRSRVRGCV